MTSYKDAVKEIYTVALRAPDSDLKRQITTLCVQVLTTDAPPVEAATGRANTLQHGNAVDVLEAIESQAITSYEMQLALMNAFRRIHRLEEVVRKIGGAECLPE